MKAQTLNEDTRLKRHDTIESASKNSTKTITI